MKYAVLITFPENKYREFKTKEEAERFIWKYTLEAVDIEELEGIDPEEAARLKSSPQIIYDMEYDWGDDNGWAVHLNEVDDEGNVKALIGEKIDLS